MKKIAILLLSLLMMTGCAMTAASDITLTAARTGDRVLLTLRNGSAGPILYNLCASALQRRSGATWEPVPTDEVCTMELRTLESGSSTTFDKTLPATAGAGEYRYVTNVESAGARVVVESNPFTVD